MKLLPKWVGSIKREVSVEGTGWFFGGGWTVRQLKGLALLVPAVAAGFLLSEGPLKQVVVWASFAAWVLYVVVTWAAGTVFLGKKMDRYHDRKVRPNLSKEYRKR